MGTGIQISALLERFKSLRILVVGDLMVDEYLWGRVTRISPEAPIPVVEVTKEESKPGGAANVGRNMLTLGAKVAFSGVVGRDEAGRRLVEGLREIGGNTEGVLEDASRPTTIKTRVIAQHQQVVRIDREKALPLSAELCAQLEKHLIAQIKAADGIIFSDYNKGLLNEALVQRLMAQARGKIITADPKPENMSYFKGASLITPNKNEAALATGMKLRSDADVEAAARSLQKMFSLGAVLITRGEEGMTLLSDGRFLHVPTHAKQVFDVTGAGDTVISVATLARCAGASMEEASILSNKAAGISVAHIGVHAVTPDELKGLGD
jgi:D-beta-D-heptose 7-phosphate kinase/D-beta-D-heptose 1-phosphate adenosyltransferase